MIEIEGPDGVIYEFPEGTSEDVMRQALQQVYGAPSQPAQSPEMTAGLAELSGMMQNPAVMPPSNYDDPLLPPRADAPYPEPVAEPAQEWGLGDWAMDIGGAALSGLGRGVTGIADMVPTPTNFARNVTRDAGMISDWMGGDGSGWRDAGQQMFPTMRESAAILTDGASEYKGESLPAQYAGTVAEFIPGAVAGGFTGGGSMLGNVLRYGVAPGLASETAGQATEGTALEPYARVAAALASGPLVNLAESGFRRVVSPYGGADPERLALAQTLDDAGVPLTAGQRVGNEGLRRKEALSGRGQAIAADQKEAFTAAALKATGTDANRATPEVLSATSKRIGDAFDDVLRGVDIMPSPETAAKIDDALIAFTDSAPSGGAGPAVMAEMSRRVKTAAETGEVIPASIVAGWRSRLSKMTTSSDAAVRDSGRMAMEALDDALEGTLVGLGRTDDVAKLATAREQWRNFLAVQRAATGAGENAAAGLISPSALRNAMVQQGRSAYAQGRRGDLGDLARAGEGVLKALPDSGTPAGLAARGLNSTNIAAVLGTGAGAHYGGPMGAMAGLVASAAAPGTINFLRTTRPVQKWLANQLLGSGPDILGPQAISPVAAALSGFSSAGASGQ